MRFRVLKPYVSEWFEIHKGQEGNDAIQHHHAQAHEGFSFEDGSTYRVFLYADENPRGIREVVSLRLYEINYGDVSITCVSRMFYGGISRAGTRSATREALRTRKIAEICEELGETWEHLIGLWDSEDAY